MREKRFQLLLFLRVDGYKPSVWKRGAANDSSRNLEKVWKRKRMKQFVLGNTLLGKWSSKTESSGQQMDWSEKLTGPQFHDPVLEK